MATLKLNVDVAKVPYKITSVMDNQKVELTIYRNRLHDFYTMTLKVNGDFAIREEKIVAGCPMWLTGNRNALPGWVIMPLSNNSKAVGDYNKETAGKSFELYLMDARGLEDVIQA